MKRSRTSQNLTKDEIIRKRSDIRNVFINGKTRNVRGVKIKFIKNDFVFSRVLVTFVKNYGKSVDRNREKRKVKEIYRLLKRNIVPGFDIVFIIFPGKYSFRERLQQIEDILFMSELLQATHSSSVDTN